MPDVDRRWGGSTLRDRRAVRREQLLDAGLELVGTGGAVALTVRAACRAARLSERYFYESFADREALLVAVHDRVADRARRTIAEAVETATTGPPEGLAEAAIGAFADHLDEDPRRGRVLLVESFADPELTRHGVELIPSFAALVTARIALLWPPGHPDAPDATDAELTANALVGALTQLFLGRLRGTLPVDRDRLVAHAAALVAAAAPTRSGPRPSDG